MKALFKLALISTIVFSTVAMAHEGHGKVDDKKIIQAAQTSAKILTFKDKDMTVGKLDKSWSKVAKDKFEIVEQNDEIVLVKAKNEQNQQILYFSVNTSGKVMDVKDAKTFKHAHGHSH